MSLITPLRGCNAAEFSEQGSLWEGHLDVTVPPRAPVLCFSCHADTQPCRRAGCGIPADGMDCPLCMAALAVSCCWAECAGAPAAARKKPDKNPPHSPNISRLQPLSREMLDFFASRWALQQLSPWSRMLMPNSIMLLLLLSVALGQGSPCAEHAVAILACIGHGPAWSDTGEAELASQDSLLHLSGA